MAASKKNDSESRDKLRITRVLPVDCKLIALPKVQISKHSLKVGGVFGGRTINLSKNGMQIHSDFELDKKTVVEVTLALDSLHPKKIKMRVEVAWAKRNAAAIYGRWGMGMRIIQAHPEDLASLAALFEKTPA